MFRQEGVCHRTQATSIYHVLIIRKHLDGLSNPSIHPHRSFRTLRDGSFGVRCPRHFVPGYDRAVPPGLLPVALTPPCAHGTAPISDQTVSYTAGRGLFGHEFQKFVSGYDRLTRIAQQTWEAAQHLVAVCLDSISSGAAPSADP